jgi:hypothetical protein
LNRCSDPKDTMQTQRNGYGLLMLAKLRQVVCVQGFIYFMMYNLLEMLGKVMEFMVPLGSAGYGDSRRLLPVRARNPLIRMRVDRRQWASWDPSRTGRTRHLNPARHPFPSSPPSE